MSFCFGWIVLHVFWLLVVLQFSFSNLSWIGWRKREIDDLCECFGSCVFWIVEGYWSVLVYFKVDKSCKMKIWKFEFCTYGVSKFPYINLKIWIFLILLDFWTLGKFWKFSKVFDWDEWWWICDDNLNSSWYTKDKKIENSIYLVHKISLYTENWNFLILGPQNFPI